MLTRVRSHYSSVVATLALVAAVGGSAIAATTSQNTSNTINACVAKKGKKKGVMRLATKCKKREKLVSWNKQGVPGTPGAAGVAGAAGAAGPTGLQGPKGDAGAPGSDQSAPTHAVMAFNLVSCPGGWLPYTAAQGRYIVGTPPAGTLGGTDGTPLSDLEDRPTGKHDHAVNDPGHSHAIDADAILTGGNVTAARVQGTADQQASTTTTLPGAAKLATTGITIEPAGSVNGTNAPYVQLLVCEKA